MSSLRAYLVNANFIVVVILPLVSHAATEVDHWSYWGEDGPDQWPGVCKFGEKQSPINIVSDSAVRGDLGALKFIRYDYAYRGTVTNTGHTVYIKLDNLSASNVHIELKGGGLPSIFTLEQMHFHWGSEHTIDGVRYPLELHLVHYNKQYGNITEAAKHENGVAVVATLFELSKDDNMALMPILTATKSVSDWVGRSMTDLRMKVIPSLFLPNDYTTYFRYEGSFTTPDCVESVVWFVLTEKLTVSEPQLDVFKNVGTVNGKLHFNYRPTQGIHGRKVYHHLLGYSGSGNFLSSSSCVVIFSTLLVRLIQSRRNF